jgi:hypothetical protein
MLPLGRVGGQWDRSGYDLRDDKLGREESSAALNARIVHICTIWCRYLTGPALRSQQVLDQI